MKIDEQVKEFQNGLKEAKKLDIDLKKAFVMNPIKRKVWFEDLTLIYKIPFADIEERYEQLTQKPIEQDNDFLFENLANVGNIWSPIEQFCKLQPIYFDRAKNWWIWNKFKGSWIRVDETDLLLAVDENLKNPNANSRLKTEVIEALRRIGRKTAPKESKNSWIQFRNLIIDVETGEEFESTPEYFITNPIPFALGESEETPEIDKLFTDWVGKEHVQELYEILAFCLFNEYIIHRIICLIGAGANGKSTYIKLIKRFIGFENVVSTSLDLLTTNRFGSSKLYKKLVCLMGETNFSTIKRTELLKSLTGEDQVSAEFKGKDSFDFVNVAKLIIATNSLPLTLDKTVGYYRRWKIIDFVNQFKKEKDVLAEISDKEFENLALKCLNIAKRLWKDRTLTNEGDFEERKKIYEEKSNPLMLFIKQNFKKELNGKIIFSEFYTSLIEFLQENGYRTLTSQKVSQVLKSEGFEIKTKKVKKDGHDTTAKCIFGLVVKEGLSSLTSLTTFHSKSTYRVLSENLVKYDKLAKPEVQKLGGKT